MVILYIHQYFKIPEEGGAIRSYLLAKGLVEDGYEVIMLTSHNKKSYEEKVLDGIRVIYLPIYYDNKLKFYGRVYAFLKFFISAYKKSASLKEIDFCYATSTPLTVGLLALLIKLRRGVPYYFEVRDLWPEAPIQMKVIRNIFLKTILYKTEKLIYKYSRSIIVLSPEVAESIQRKTPEKEVVLIPNISDCDFFVPQVKDPLLQEKYGVKNSFVITYFGTVGKANHLYFLLHHAKACKEATLKELKFMIIGQGAEFDRIKKAANVLELDSLIFFDFMNKSGLKEILNVTDAVYISFKNIPVLETCSPNKFFDALAAGKLIIVNFGGWIRALIEKNKCGFYSNPDQPEEFPDQIRQYMKNQSLLLEQQNSARKLAEKNFEKENQIRKLIKVFRTNHTSL